MQSITSRLSDVSLIKAHHSTCHLIKRCVEERISKYWLWVFPICGEDGKITKNVTIPELKHEMEHSESAFEGTIWRPTVYSVIYGLQYPDIHTSLSPTPLNRFIMICNNLLSCLSHSPRSNLDIHRHFTEWVNPLALALPQEPWLKGLPVVCVFPNYSFLLSKHALGDSSRTAVCQRWLERSVLFQHQCIFQAEWEGGRARP